MSDESPSSRELARRLTNELNEATAEFMRLQRLEWEIVAEAPSGLPLSDGLTRIVQAGKASRAAFEKYEQAVRRYRDFVDRAVVPDKEVD
ncbi:MAG TPA: hypothetical protein VML19_23210 [Verrucomicrobiae bacterium]|nr:hypothetical protein [Verrucomicrobiae bacterium]